MINRNKLHPVVTERFIRGSKLNILIDFIVQLYFKVPNEVIVTLHLFIWKIPNRRELRQNAVNQSSD